MVRTPLCDLLGIEVPLIQAGMGGAVTSAELVAAVSDAGGMGSLGTWQRPINDVREQLARIRALTSRPFAVNFASPFVDDDAFALTLATRPAVIVFAVGDAGEYAVRAKEAGIRVVQQVHTVEQARAAAERGVDAIIAQGGDAGGGVVGKVGTLTLVPQVVDAVRPLPVVAAGGIADGRALAAVLMLGGQGVNLGTRFLASREAPVSEDWKQAILAATSEEVIQFPPFTELFPFGERAYPDTAPRARRTPFLDTWQQQRDAGTLDAGRIRREVMAAIDAGRIHELLPLMGQSAGAMHAILPAGEIVRRIAAEAREVLKGAAAFLPDAPSELVQAERSGAP